jgi:FAD/FMN-containing dehydrogenase
MVYDVGDLFDKTFMKEITRRRFIKSSVIGATMFAAGKLDLAAIAEDTEKTVAADSSAESLKGLLSSLHVKGRVVTASDSDYLDAREDYNGRFSSHPKAIIYCENELDVSETIKWARHNRFRVSIRSGGHSYEGFSVIDDGIVIDVSKLDQIVIDTKNKTATVGSGVTLLPFYEALWAKGMVVPAGSCSSVGIGGSTLGGGFGLLSRHMGLTCDNLIGLKLVDANGKLLKANETENRDLLWACKGGGGGNFGVVTEFTFKTHAIENVTIFRVKWKYEDIATVIKTWQKWAPCADDRLTCVLTMTSKKSNRVSCVGVFLGSQSEVRKQIAPLLQTPEPISLSVNSSSWMDAVIRFSGLPRASKKNESVKTTGTRNGAQKTGQKSAGKLASGPAAISARNTQPNTPHETVHMHIHPRFKNTSDYVNKDLTDEGIRTIVSFLEHPPVDSSCIQFDSYGGKITQIPVTDTAFCHRADTKFCMHYQISWRNPSQDEHNMQWVNDFKKAMKPHVSGFNYVNYCDREIENFARSYYGNNLERLVEIKRKYDPDNFFSFAQSIPMEPSPKP